MGRHLVFSILFLLFSELSFPQWQWQNPLPQGNDLYSTFFVDPLNGFSVGDWGTILKTWDGGNHWQMMACPVHTDLKNVWFADVFNGWASGGPTAIILHTADGGITWDIQYDAGAGNQVSGVAFTDPLHGFAVGDAGGGIHLLKTTDGGVNWIPQTNPPFNEMLNAIHFVNSSMGWIAGSNGIYRTTDSGNTWMKQSSTGAMGLCFLNDSLIFAAGSSIQRTLDGGLNWELLQSNTGEAFQSIALINKDTGWVVGSWYSNVCWKTTNGGLNWIPQTLWTGNYFHAISFTDDHTGWITGTGGLLLKTENSGTTWVDKRIMATDRNLNKVQFTDPNNGYVAGDGVVLKTTNGGATWDTVIANSARSFTDLRFINASTGWVTASGTSGTSPGTVFKTTDGGAHWTVQGNSAMKGLFSCWFLDPNTGWVAGNGAYVYGSGQIFKTSDGGATWNLQLSDSLGEVTSLNFTDASHGWALRLNDKLSKTTDGGNTWTTSYIGSGQYLYKTQFLNPDTGWVAGWYTLAKTTNGGASWHWQLQVDVYDLCFITADTGWAVGGFSPGMVMKTTDGGTSWTWLDCLTGNIPNGVCFTDASNGWIIGYNGMILKTGNGGGFTEGIDPAPGTKKPEHGLSIFPNPAGAKCSMLFTLEKPGPVELQVLNSKGAVILKKNLGWRAAGENRYICDLSGFARGLYLVKIVTCEKVIKKKLLKN